MTIDSPEFPPPPREVTPLVRRRAWFDRRVRAWWVMAVILIGVATYYALSRLYFWAQEARLISKGDKVQAEVTGGGSLGSDSPKGKVLAPDEPIYLRYSYKGQPYQTFGVLRGRKEQVVTRSTVPIYV